MTCPCGHVLCRICDLSHAAFTAVSKCHPALYPGLVFLHHYSIRARRAETGVSPAGRDRRLLRTRALGARPAPPSPFTVHGEVRRSARSRASRTRTEPGCGTAWRIARGPAGCSFPSCRVCRCRFSLAHAKRPRACRATSTRSITFENPVDDVDESEYWKRFVSRVRTASRSMSKVGVHRRDSLATTSLCRFLCL